MKQLLIATLSLFVYFHITAQEVLKTPVDKMHVNTTKNINDTIVALLPILHDISFVSDKAVVLNSYYIKDQNNLTPILLSELNNFCPEKNQRSLNFVVSKNEIIMPELMVKQSVEVGGIFSHNKLVFSLGLIANVYNFNPLSTMSGSVIQNQFGIYSRLSYDFNNNVSASVYGRYVTNSFFHSMASFPYVATSTFGGFFTLHSEKYGIDMGVNNYYDPFNRCWRTNPIVRPAYKIGKVKITIDVGPLIKEGFLHIVNKQRAYKQSIISNMRPKH